MLPLNPFLSAFFRSPLPTQCTHTHQLILLVPTTDLLLTHHESDTGASAQEILLSEEFIASHILRIPGGGANGSAEPVPNLREVRGKAKQYPTLNGRSVVIKDGFVYSNKGAARPRELDRLGPRSRNTSKLTAGACRLQGAQRGTATSRRAMALGHVRTATMADILHLETPHRLVGGGRYPARRPRGGDRQEEGR